MNKIIVRCEIAIVQAYPCLYDKSDPGYKDKLRKQNTWNTVGDAIGYNRG